MGGRGSSIGGAAKGGKTISFSEVSSAQSQITFLKRNFTNVTNRITRAEGTLRKLQKDSPNYQKLKNLEENLLSDLYKQKNAIYDEIERLQKKVDLYKKQNSTSDKDAPLF